MLNRSLTGFTVINVQRELAATCAEHGYALLAFIEGLGELFIALDPKGYEMDPSVVHAALSRAGRGGLPLGVRVHAQFVSDRALLDGLEAAFRLGGIKAIQPYLPRLPRNAWMTW